MKKFNVSLSLKINIFRKKVYYKENLFKIRVQIIDCKINKLLILILQTIDCQIYLSSNKSFIKKYYIITDDLINVIC